jgi:3-methyladenine DNA glycosylase Tag
MNPVSFQAVEEAALLRLGSAALQARLAVPKSAAELEATGDDRYLSSMSLRLFRAGLKHELVDRKWPAFEEVFLGFDPARVAGLSDEALEALLQDKRLIRHMGKLRAVRANAGEFLAIAEEHGSFARWLARWPVGEITGLWASLAKRMQHLGGQSAPYFLRMVGKDTFVLTDSVVRGLVYWEIADGPPRGKAEIAALQAVFNRWQEETGRPLCQLSQILALSVD